MAKDKNDDKGNKKPKPVPEPIPQQSTIDGFSYVEDSRNVGFRRKLGVEIRRLHIDGCSVLHIDVRGPCLNYDRWTAFIYYNQQTE